MADIVGRLSEASERLSGRSLDRGCVDSGLASSLADAAIAEIERLRALLEEGRQDLTTRARLDWKNKVTAALTAGERGQT